MVFTLAPGSRPERPASRSPVPGVLRIVCKLSGVAVHTSLYVLCTQIPVRIGFFPSAARLPPPWREPGARVQGSGSSSSVRTSAFAVHSRRTRSVLEGVYRCYGNPVDISLPAAYQDTKYGTFIRIVCEKIRQTGSDLDGDLGRGLRRTCASVF